MKKYQIKLLLVLALLMFKPIEGHTIERAGQIGQTWSLPVFFRPTKSYDEITYHFETAYFLSEQFAAAFTVNTQLQGRNTFYLELGPDYYPFPDFWIQPFITARLLYTFEPAKDAGGIASIGFELPMGKSYQIQNLKLRLSSGGGVFFVDKQNDFFLELVRLGLVWTF